MTWYCPNCGESWENDPGMKFCLKCCTLEDVDIRIESYTEKDMREQMLENNARDALCE